jgi:NADH-quinone oxidoreductase subunit M
MSNIALPGTSSFIGELLLLMGSFISNFFITCFIISCVVLGGSYSLWLYNKIIYGNLKSIYLNSYLDINFKEFFILSFLLLFTLFLGIFPYFLLNYLHITSIIILLPLYI